MKKPSLYKKAIMISMQFFLLKLLVETGRLIAKRQRLMALNVSSREDTLIREDTLVEAQMCHQWDERTALSGLGDAGSVGL